MPIINLFKIDDEKQKDFFDGVFEKISSKEKEYAGENGSYAQLGIEL